MQCRQVAVPVRDCIRAFSQREDKETAELCELNSAAAQAGLRHVIEEKLQIELFRATVLEIKLSLSFSLNDHTGSYITVLTGGESDVATAVRGAEEELNTDELISRRDDISLQGMMTITTAVREVEEEEEDVEMRVILLQLSDAAVFTFN
ncbi:hypothetical protein BDFG_09283 [Blastomyces dermatitidis ATCC 26199]|nr:hypothetical protein BDFG_09283 [Blastomyces dermatitidis ATCC 26199]